MHELDDKTLLRDYIERDSQEAFATLVARHVNKVYSVALRHTCNPIHAEEITQSVFVILAQKARKLGKKVILSGWLYQTARLTAITFIRSEIRRTRREQEAYMQSVLNETESNVWPQIAPLLDAAMAKLSETDRHAIVLRFFDGKSMREVSTVLGASEDAAKMRVNRAVERLRVFFFKRGVVVSAGILTAAISANSVHAAPVALANAATAAALAKGTTVATSVLTLTKGALKTMAWSKGQAAIVPLVATILAVSTTTLVIHHNHQTSPPLDFPRPSWKNAGYDNPVSGLETAIWASSQGDGKMIFASLSPNLQQAWEQSAKQAGFTPEELLSQNEHSGHHLDGITGFRVVRSEAPSSSEVRLHLSMGGKQGDQIFTMIKVGSQWKLDSVPTDF